MLCKSPLIRRGFYVCLFCEANLDAMRDRNGEVGMDKRERGQQAQLKTIYEMLHDTHVLEKFLERRGHCLSEKQRGMITGALDTLRWLSEGGRDPFDCLLVDLLAGNRGKTLHLEVLRDAPLGTAYEDERDQARTALFFRFAAGYGDTWFRVGEDGQRDYLASNTTRVTNFLNRIRRRKRKDA
jgi:hypothetical protein